MQQQYQLMMANPALMAHLATPIQTTQPTQQQQQPAQPQQPAQHNQLPPTHPSAPAKKRSSSAPNSPTTAVEPPFDTSDLSDDVVRCVCASFHRTGKLLSCSGCGVLQHRSCIGRTATGGKSAAIEYYCELCEPTAPVHVGRELMMQRKEREWKAKLKGSASSGNKRKRRREDGGGQERVNGGTKGGEGEEVEVAVVVDEDDEMKRLTEMFRAEIDTGLFESDTEKDRTDQQHYQHRGHSHCDDTEAVKLEEELKLEISKARRHVEQNRREEVEQQNGSSKAVDADEERKEAPPAPLLLLHTPRHHRTMTDSEKDAAAAISLLSPRPPLAPLTSTAAARGSPHSTSASVRSSPTRSRFVFPTEGLLALSPHRSTSSPNSSASTSSSVSSASSSSAAFFSVRLLVRLHHLHLHQPPLRPTPAPLTVRSPHPPPSVTAAAAAHSACRRRPSVGVARVCCSVRARQG